MGILITAYGSQTYREYFFPDSGKSENALILTKDQFHIEQDINVLLSVRGGDCSFVESSEYHILKNGEPWWDKPLAPGDILHCECSGGVLIRLFFQYAHQLLHPSLKFDTRHRDQITIGRGENCDICISAGKYIGREHMVLELKGNTCLLRDNSRNGVFVNGERVIEYKNILPGDLIYLFGIKIVWLREFLAIWADEDMVHISAKQLSILSDANISAAAAGADMQAARRASAEIVHRSPRSIPKIEEAHFEIEQPPQKEKENQRSLLSAIGPSATMAIPMMLGSGLAILGTSVNGSGGSAFMYTGLITAVSSAMIGSFWSARNLNAAKRESVQAEEERVAAYRDYLQGKARQIEENYLFTRDALNMMYPSAGSCSLYDGRSRDLWSRNRYQKDFLYVRLGLGTRPFPAAIQVQEPRFHVHRDPVESEPVIIRERYKTLDNVPVGIDISSHKVIGIVGGPEKEGAWEVARSVMTQLAANASYTDVKIGLVYNGSRQIEREQLGMMKWLPHTWSEDRKFRYVADNRADAGELFFELAEIIRRRAEEVKQEHSENRQLPLPWYVLFLTDYTMLEGELITKYLTEPGKSYGITTILLAAAYEDLPNTCGFVIENDLSFEGIYSVGKEETEFRHISFDSLGTQPFRQFAQELANLRVRETAKSGEIPLELGFLEMYHVRRVQELNAEGRWVANRVYETMRVPIGMRGGDVLCYLDVHEKSHGPHGLIAGTTGSGKSETLQTYILSLAVNFSPEDVAFFIIDYKGGGMANLFEGLPHMAGQISNLSGNQVRRAMISIKSENQRRQRIFSENSVNSINQYTKLYKNGEAAVPVPHLFIIIDEFAELKREEPDFMQELISVAQVGRSLGVHLILSTQKPAGTVDDNIWSNAKFRLCLRVQDRQDSNDMLHRPDAAFITQTGRGYLQVGNDELYELFQSAWSGALYDTSSADSNKEIVRMLTATGRTMLTGNRIKARELEERRKAWFRLLLTTVKDVLFKEGLYPQNLLEDDEAMELAVRSMIRELANRHAEYSASEENLLKIRMFLHLYAEALCHLPVEQQVLQLLLLSGRPGARIPEQGKSTQLEAVVEYLASLAEQKGYEKTFSLWLPVLPERIVLSKGIQGSVFADGKWPEKKRWSLAAMIGLCDDPEHQAQYPLEADLGKDGSLAVIGSVSTGKSTLLQTVVFSLIHRYTPGEVQLYLLDFSSHMLDAFSDAPHVGGIMNEDTPERTARFFSMLSAMRDERRSRLRGGSYQQFVQTGYEKMPAIIIVIDHYAGFREKTGDIYQPLLTQIARDGIGSGIYLILSAGGFGGSEIERRIGDTIRNVLCLELTDRFAYGDALHVFSTGIYPEAGVKGRGLTRQGEAILEFQTALALEAPDDYERSEMIRRICKEMQAAWDGLPARRIPEIPEDLSDKYFFSLPDVRHALEDPAMLPAGYCQEDASIWNIRLPKTFVYLISGRPRSGKTNFLKILIQAAYRKDGMLFIVDRKNVLKKAAVETGATYITDSGQLSEAMQELSPIVVERNKIKNSGLAEDRNEAQIFTELQNQKGIYYFIDSLQDFIDMVLHHEDDICDVREFLEVVTEKARLHHIYFFACVDSRDPLPSGVKLFENMIRDRNGIHFGGDVSSQRLMDFDYIPFSRQQDKEKAGTGYLASTDEDTGRNRILVPLAGGNSGA